MNNEIAFVVVKHLQVYEGYTLHNTWVTSHSLTAQNCMWGGSFFSDIWQISILFSQNQYMLVIFLTE